MVTKLRSGAALLCAAVMLATPHSDAHAQGVPRPALGPIEIVPPPSLDSAVAHGTRSRNGAPGPRYWQNWVDYRIAAQITPADSMLMGQETITYHNNSPDTLTRVVFHLYQNLMGSYAPRQQAVRSVTQGMVMDSLYVGGHALPLPDNQVGQAPGRSDVRIYGTLMLVPLPTPLAPGDTETFQVGWHFTIPGRFAPRMGMQDDSTAQIAQWYPQIAVYDDVHGQDLQQYTGTGEFYLEYGHFRYSVTLPAGFIVGGTGTLLNPKQVLTPTERQALERAERSDDVVHVVTEHDFGPGKATAAAASPGGTLTWTFAADSVRDVAFSFSSHYLWDATSAVVDSGSGRRSAVHVLYRKGAPLFDRVWSMAKAALETHSSRMVPYPWPQLTETEGGFGGMEYPMTVFVQADSDLYREDEVTAHEIGHEWFPMLVGSNETRYGWQDEGLNTFDTFFATDAYLPDSLRRHGVEENMAQYVRFVTTADEDLQIMSPANAFGISNGGYGVEAYAKPAIALWALRSILGDETFSKAYRTYIHRWEYKHPTPWDFFHTFNDVTGQDLDAFFQPWFFTRDKLDQAVTAVSQANGRVTVTVANRGRLYAPIDVTATLADGKTVQWREPMTVWYDGQQLARTSHAVSGSVKSVTVDAARDFPDVDRSNNTWTKP